MLLVSSLLPGSALAAPGPLCYVNVGVAGGADDGSSWANAYDDLQEALADPNCVEIWVAAGTYLPDGADPGNRVLRFSIEAGVQVYGGFDGTETAREQRDWVNNVTILSGDLNGDDGANFANNSENTQAVVNLTFSDGDTVLDGLTISGGRADTLNNGGGIWINAAVAPQLANLIIRDNQTVGNFHWGGGMLLWNGASPILTDVRFISNFATYGGGGLLVGSAASEPELTRVTFEDNEAVGYGGGLFVLSGSANINDSVFRNNSANLGGALANDDRAYLNYVVFEGNAAGIDGGAIWVRRIMEITESRFDSNTAADKGGAIRILGVNVVTLDTVVFSDNSAAAGGALWVGRYSGGSPVNNFSNLTFSGNQSTGDGGAILLVGGTLNLRDSTLLQNEAAGDGGGLSVTGGTASIMDTTFEENEAANGGGLYNTIDGLVLERVVFDGNSAIVAGGGMNNDENSPTLNDVTFYANQAVAGGGMTTTDGNPVLDRVTFDSNFALGGGGLSIGSGAPELTNVTFYLNVAFAGGGLINDGGDPVLNNVTFSANDAEGFYNNSGNATINNAIFWGDAQPPTVVGGSLALVDAVVQGGCPVGAACTNIIESNPALQPLAANGGPTKTMALGDGSSAIDSGGVNVACAGIDQRGRSRPLDGNDDGVAACDLGAFEVDPGVATALGSSGSQSIDPTTTTIFQFGRLYVIVPAGALPSTASNCRIEVHEQGSSGQFGFELDDVVWDVEITCDSGIVNIFFAPLTICIEPVDAVLNDKQVFHRHDSATAFSALARSFEVPGHVCGQTRVLSLFTLGSVNLPATGFAPGAQTELGAAMAYSSTALTLDVPALDIVLPIVGVPQTPNGWDVSWLGNSAGFLQGTAFPTLAGNTVITAHVWGADNQPGPFAKLETLSYGDRFSIEAWGGTYIYEVRNNTLFSPNSLSPLGSEDYDWVTLVTCAGFDESTGEYAFRRVVRAVLVSVD